MKKLMDPDPQLLKFIESYDEISFTGGTFSKACHILHSIFKLEEKIQIFISLSGALVPAGLQSHIVSLLKTGKISGVITTGATLTHDYLEDLGFKHKKLHHFTTDAELRKNGINRILDVGATDEAFEKMEISIHEWMEKNYPDTKIAYSVSTVDFLKELGKERSENSILGICQRKNIPIYCPAITDSMLGVHAMTFAEYRKFSLDPILELKSYISQCFDSKKTAAIVLGGGVPKNYLFQGMLISGKELSYAIQVTMDRPEHGGLSGASLDEAISWGKIQSDAKTVTVVSDVSLILPLFVKYIELINKK